MTNEIAMTPMTETEARCCADAIRNHLNDARALILELYERRGWKALGYKSWRECVVTEFDQSKTHLYRQLEAAKIEREIAPDKKPGQIPERKLRPLVRVPKGKRKEAWDEATGAANGHPTEKDVERAAAKVAPPPEPPDIKAQRAAGIIPAEAAVEVTEPEPAEVEPDPSPGEDDLSDADWLALCPARGKLSAVALKRFDIDALVYRKIAPLRLKFARACKPVTNAAKKEGKGHIGAYMDKHFWYLRTKHPRHWAACADCSGAGQVKLIGECPVCRGNGYKV